MLKCQNKGKMPLWYPFLQMEDGAVSHRLSPKEKNRPSRPSCPSCTSSKINDPLWLSPANRLFRALLLKDSPIGKGFFFKESENGKCTRTISSRSVSLKLWLNSWQPIFAKIRPCIWTPESVKWHFTDSGLLPELPCSSGGFTSCSSARSPCFPQCHLIISAFSSPFLPDLSWHSGAVQRTHCYS